MCRNLYSMYASLVIKGAKVERKTLDVLLSFWEEVNLVAGVLLLAEKTNIESHARIHFSALVH